jgi:hypothetical protein
MKPFFQNMVLIFSMSIPNSFVLKIKQNEARPTTRIPIRNKDDDYVILNHCRKNGGRIHSFKLSRGNITQGPFTL